MKSKRPLKATKVKVMSKDFLTTKEAAEYIGISVNWLHKLTMRRLIPFYKPSRKCIFKREELAAWIEARRVKTIDELQELAEVELKKKKKGGQR